MQHVIYVDVLVFLNTVITFIILLTTTEISGIEPHKARLITGSVVGGLYSLIILAPPMNMFFIITARLAICVSVVFITYHIRNLRKMMRCLVCFIIISFIFAGGIYAIAGITDNDFISVNNSYGYMNLSTAGLIFITLIFYIAIKIINKNLFHRKSEDMVYRIDIRFHKRRLSTYALFDSGNSVTDAYTGRPVIILDDNEAYELLENSQTEIIRKFFEEDNILIAPPDGFRIIPVKTLGGEKILPAFTADGAEISDGDVRKIIDRPCIAITADIPEDKTYKALINEAIIKQAV